MEEARVGMLPMLVALASASGDAALNHSGDGGSGVATPSDWWAGVVEEDAIRSLSLDGEGGLWSSAFVPPPPRPAYLDENISNDGLTTCDLCTWAWHDNGVFSVDAAQDTEELGWVLTLAIVSILSAAIGAAIMITLLQCRSGIKNIGSTCSLCMTRSAGSGTESTRPGSRPPQGSHKEVTCPYVVDSGGGGVWTWLSGRRSSSQLAAAPAAAPAENHYTLDEAHYGEALYAELDRESTPAYQNTAYAEEEAVVSSAPSSAYYSDLSNTDRTYEQVGAPAPAPTAIPIPVPVGWEMGELPPRRHPRLLAAITETMTVPSDYV